MYPRQAKKYSNNKPINSNTNQSLDKEIEMHCYKVKVFVRTNWQTVLRQN